MRSLAVLTALTLSVAPLHGQPTLSPPPPDPGYVPGRILLRLDPAQMTACMHCQWAAAAPIGGGLDELNTAVGVTDVIHLHDAFHANTVAEMSAEFARQIDVARVENPDRAAREVKTDVQPLVEELLNTYVLEFPPEQDPEDVAAEYRQNPIVLDARPDYYAQLFAFNPTDPFWTSANAWGQVYFDLWGLRQIGADKAWQLSRGAGVKLAVQDTGVERLHPDLGPSLCTKASDPPDGVDNDGNGYKDDYYCGFNFAQRALGGASGCPAWGGFDYGNPCDQHEHSHGSHVAGTAAAASNGVGVLGVAPEAKIMPLKIFSLSGLLPLSGVYDSLMYAASQGADVLNASWGCVGTSCGLGFYFGLNYLYGVTMVAAAGNNGSLIFHEPAMLDDIVLTVGASDLSSERADFSNFGPELDIVAPGGGHLQTCSCGGDTDWCSNTTRNILSARSFLVTPNDTPGCLLTNDLVPFNGNHALNVGTSMASPHGAGAAAVVLSRFPWMNPLDVHFVLKHSAVDVTTASATQCVATGPGVDPCTGYGRLQVGRAVANSVMVRTFQDAWVGSGEPNDNHGAEDRLKVDGANPQRISYVKFDLRNVAAHQGAGLRVCTRPLTGSPGGGRVHVVDPNAWSEGAVTWNNRPALGTQIAQINDPVVAQMPQDTCVVTDITPHVHPKQINSFAIAKPSQSADGLAYWSREGHATDRAPHLLLSTCNPTGCRTCNGATIVEANMNLVPLAAILVLYGLYDRLHRRRTHATRAGTAPL